MSHSALRLTVVALCAASLLAACKNGQSNTTTPAPKATSTATQAGAGEPSPDTVVATIGDEKITLGQVEEKIAPQLKQLQEQVEKQKFEMRRNATENFVLEKVLTDEAQKRGLAGPEALLQAEVDGKITEPTDEEIQATYDEAAENLPPGATIDTYRPQIVEFLKSRQRQQIATQFVEQIKAEKGVNILLEAPRVEVEATGPSMGPEDAKVTIVEFSDFECPYCARGRTVVEEVMKAYPEQVRVVFRHFPLDFHPNAQKAGEAAMCAHDQNKFWEMHDKLFDNQKALGVDALKGYAQELELDTQAFNTCLESGKHAQVVRNDMAAGAAAGVTGTPAFFVNGIPLNGAVPFSQFKSIIDEELRRTGG
ncbi:MAG TPA: thioredoxin domain-containing protein [Myxococcaceae bacterium]|nr:thioredoxin domain-containing protein [Myxococcaceae bacterium]